MLFSSLIFVWFFLPIVFIGNYLIRKIGRHGGNAAENIFLLIASFFFMHKDRRESVRCRELFWQQEWGKDLRT